MTDPRPLDLARPEEVVDRLLAAQAGAVAAARAVAAEIAAAVDVVTGRIAAGGRVRLVAADPVAARVLELVTADLETEFGLADGAVTRAGVAPVDAPVDPTARDAVVVVACGRPDAAAAVIAAAQRRGAGLVVVAAVPAADVLAGLAADVRIVPIVPPEQVRGLARLGAATALKAVLDALTTAVVAQLGRVHGDLPVDLVAGTDAEREFVVAMVEQLAGVDPDTAATAARASGHDVRVAVLGLVAGLGPVQASTLAANRRTLRDALATLPRRPPP